MKCPWRSRGWDMATFVALSLANLSAACSNSSPPLDPRVVIRTGKNSKITTSRSEQLVTIVGLGLQRDWNWAAVGDRLMLGGGTVRFPYVFQGDAVLRVRKRGRIWLVNTRASAVDLSGLPPEKIEFVSKGTLARKARCAYWSGSPNGLAAVVSVLAKLKQRCISIDLVQPPHGPKAKSVLRLLGERVEQLTLKYKTTSSEALSQLKGIRILHIKYVDSEETPPGIYKIACGLPLLEHLRVSAESVRDRGSVSTADLMRCQRLRRLEAPEANIVGKLDQIARLPKLIALRATLFSDDTAAPKLVGRTALRELRLTVQDTWKGSAVVRWISGAQKLRVLTLRGVCLKDAEMKVLSGFRNLQVLDLQDTLVTQNVRWPAWPLLQALRFGHGVIPFTWLLRKKHLRTLDLGDNDLTADQAKALGRLQQLESLVLSASKRTSLFVSSLASLGIKEKRRPLSLAFVARLVRLKHLDVSSNKHCVAKSFSHLGALRSLESLDLMGSSAGDVALKALAGLRRLKWLNLARTRVTNNGLKHISKLPGLIWLDLQDTEISDGAATALAGLVHLRHLELTNVDFSDRGLAQLATLKHLRYLGLRGTSVSLNGPGLLAPLSALQRLDLSHSNLESTSLSKQKIPRDLQRLGVAFTFISGSDLEPLAKGASLTHLDIRGTAIGDKDLPLLLAMQGLRELDARFTQLSLKAAPRLLTLRLLERLALSAHFTDTKSAKQAEAKAKHPALLLVIDVEPVPIEKLLKSLD